MANSRMVQLVQGVWLLIMAAIPDLIIKVDCLNEEPFMDVVQLAIDVCACAEELAEQHEGTPAADRLFESTRAFRKWFAEG